MNKIGRMPRDLRSYKNLGLFIEGEDTQEEQKGQDELLICNQQRPLSEGMGRGLADSPTPSLLACSYVVPRLKLPNSALVSKDEGQCHSGVHSDAVFTLRP